MQGYSHAAQIDSLPVRDAFDIRLAEALAQNGDAVAMAEVGGAAPARMIGVAMRDDRAFNAPPRINVKVSRRTIESGGAGDDQVHPGNLQGDSRAAFLSSCMFNSRQNKGALDLLPPATRKQRRLLRGGARAARPDFVTPCRHLNP